LKPDVISNKPYHKISSDGLAMLLEVHIEMNLRNQGDEFHNKEKVNNRAKGRNQEDQRKVEKWTQ